MRTARGDSKTTAATNSRRRRPGECRRPAQLSSLEQPNNHQHLQSAYDYIERQNLDDAESRQAELANVLPQHHQRQARRENHKQPSQRDLLRKEQRKRPRKNK